ncbi:hypothetical protein PCORN_00065 [Listeria cornellensis FSL F6-0969]|uniref:Uncharacterized protein n=1 Tax=Listeria cornellensis FSL F6-0969 TaxID=1265820 RepID=W7CBA7_9LIST|nr:hypothetical protein PCORN_00065 [Listeria cornellensis FSL F6-0969]
MAGYFVFFSLCVFGSFQITKISANTNRKAMQKTAPRQPNAPMTTGISSGPMIDAMPDVEIRIDWAHVLFSIGYVSVTVLAEDVG